MWNENPHKKRLNFKSTFKYVAYFFKHKNDEVIKTIPGTIEHYPEFLDIINIFTNDSRYKDIKALYDEDVLNKKGIGMTMDSFFDKMLEKGEKRGIELGEKRGEFKAYKKLNYTNEQIAALMDLDINTVNKLEQELFMIQS